MKRRRLSLLCLGIALLLAGSCALWMRQANRQYALNRQLIAALVRNDYKQALALVNAGADPNTRYDPPPAPTAAQLLSHLLHRSSVPGDESPTAFLLVCGGGVQWVDSSFPPHVDEASRCLLAKTMLAHGARISAVKGDDDTPIRAAVNANRLCLMELLLTHGANVDAQGTNGATSLMVAAESNFENMALLLLAHHANVNIQNEADNTALHFAIGRGESTATIRELMARGADPNLSNANEETAFSLAHDKQRPDLIQLLHKSGK